MKNSFSLLKFRQYLADKKITGKLSIIILGVASTIWFLLRVIPKPSRAGYPCMRAAAPFMSGFIVYILTLTGSIIAFKNAKHLLKKASYVAAFSFLVVGLISFFVFSTGNALDIFAKPSEVTGPIDGPNQPMGVAQGIVPGRVVWAWEPKATNPNCNGTRVNCTYVSENDNVYHLNKNTIQSYVDSMVRSSVLHLANQNEQATAWEMLFKNHNKKKGKGDVSYSSNEIIFIKINMGGVTCLNTVGPDGKEGCFCSHTIDLSQVTTSMANITNTTPQIVMAVLRDLINNAGVPAENIYVGDPMKNVYKKMADYWFAEFPNINVLGNNLVGSGNGVDLSERTPVQFGSQDRIFYSDKGQKMKDAVSDKFYTIIEDADYMINIACLKAHACAGITLCAKNHFGSHTRESAQHLHPGILSQKNDEKTWVGYSKYYRVQVDLIAHELLGGNTMLFIVDGLWGGKEGWDDTPPVKWKMQPFNTHFPSSIFMSLDQVALESVCYDFLRVESNTSKWSPNRANYNGVDDYLHQAADKSNWPTGINYDPENDGTIIGSLGTHEHWNDSIKKQYSRNLNPSTGKGIELKQLKTPWTQFELYGVGFNKIDQDPDIIKAIYPIPASSNLTIEYNVKSNENVQIALYNLQGQLVEFLLNEPHSKGNYSLQHSIDKQKAGIYVIRIEIGNTFYSKQIQIAH